MIIHFKCTLWHKRKKVQAENRKVKARATTTARVKKAPHPAVPDHLKATKEVTAKATIPAKGSNGGMPYK